MITILCSNIKVKANHKGDPPMSADLFGTDYDDILNQIPIAEAVRYYGAHNLLANMEAGEIKEYLQP